MNSHNRRTVYLHVGHGKTGSSFLQSALALSADRLAQGHILYPDLTNSFAAAKAGRITSGNIHVDKSPLIEFIRQADKNNPGDLPLLFSNEMTFGYMLRPESPERLKKIIEEGYELKVLCFTRNPLDHAVSLYQQTVKRSGNTKELADFLQVYRVPGEVLRFIKMLNELGVETRISNYNNNKKRLLNVLEDWLGLEQNFLEKPERKTVNRSVTNGELMLQLEFNRHLGKRSSSLISDPLCNQLPDIKSEYPAIYREELAPFIERMKQAVAPVNALLPPEEAYVVPSIDEAIQKFGNPDDPQLMSFSRQQLEVIARKLSKFIISLEKE
ncbi:hypothetical protein FF098_016575 [Parvularcula flava]|uniref:Uncharacterized protein n=1 Tax=Aquisalinus luteolus TaxID=1566827 RepID=A0A8J3A6B3_9PROT|nr:hypothetical protein [Aquisalinus luteolus]NHK29526.1 hypothetical protein [Aquisalinus luteolus]GGI01673.1 hypothetical protein GCM10011355_32880 [Aquisalinus luteolus]